MQNNFPTFAPLNRKEQKEAFEALKNAYTIEKPVIPVFPVSPIKEITPSQEQQLKAVQAQFLERGLQPQVEKIEKQLEEKKTSTTIQQFYCRHVFQIVNTTWMVLPIKYKICKNCGLVK